MKFDLKKPNGLLKHLYLRNGNKTHCVNYQWKPVGKYMPIESANKKS